MRQVCTYKIRAFRPSTTTLVRSPWKHYPTTLAHTTAEAIHISLLCCLLVTAATEKHLHPCCTSKTLVHHTLDMFGAIKKLFWLKSNHGGKTQPLKNAKAEKSGVTLNAKADYTLQNSVFRQEMHHNDILLNKLNTCKGKGEGEIHTFLSTLESFILNLYLTCNKAAHIPKNATMKRVSIHLHST